MKGAVGYVVAALVLTLVGSGCVALWWLEGRMAAAEQAFGTLAFERSERELDELEQYLEYASALPWIGPASLEELRVRRMASRYWRGDYGSIATLEGDPIGRIDPDNTALQLVAANVVYRTAVGAAKDRAALVEAIDRSLGAYRSVLRNAASNEDAAYNYEYLVRLRAQVTGGARRATAPAAPDGSSPHGVRGGPPRERQSEPFEILVPQDKDTPEEDPDAGQSGPLRRRG